MSFFGAIGDLIGTGINAGIQNKVNKENADLQREFAQNSLQWKIADAKKAGIHPLAAVNAPTYSASPSFIGANVGDGISKAFSQAGDSLSKAEAQKEAKEAQAKQDLIFNEELKKARLENEKLAKEIASMGQAGFGGVKKNALGTPNEEFTKAFSNDSALNLVPAGNGNYYLGWSPDSIQGQSMSEGLAGLIVGNITGMGMYLDKKLRANLRDEARKQGILKKDEDWNFEWNGYGYTLVPEKVKSKPKKTYKPKSNMFGF